MWYQGANDAITSDMIRASSPAMEPVMTDELAEKVREHFRIWSGGCPPESEFEIIVYIEKACPLNLDEQELRDMLREWMNNATDDEYRPPLE